MRKNFYSLTLSELVALMEQHGQKRFRAEQLFRWIYVHRQTDFAQMTNISKDFRDELPKLLDLSLPEVVRRQLSQDGTKKYLFKVGSDKTIESVLIPSEGRRTLCVSSEVGCNMACQFCYTGKQKLQQRLRTDEIVGQLVQAQLLQEEDERISNIVFMGMGEPLDNCEAVFKAIEIMHSPWGLNLSRRKITVSTSGLVPQIPLVTQAGVRLAVSLNAVDDETRSRIMPINKRWPLSELLAACKVHTTETRDRVTFEYVLLKDVTDSLEAATKLYKLTRDIPCKLNIIPFNEHPGSGFFRPSEEQIQRFQAKLMALGAHVLRRRTMGRDIYAACGQLTSAIKNHPISVSL